MNSLAVCFEEGLGVERSVRSAKQWYIKAAAGGDPHAQNNLGFLLVLEGKEEQAAKLFEAAVKGGSDDALFNLGSLLEHGQEL